MQIEADMMRKNPSYLAYLDWNWILGISVSVMIFLVINVLMEILVPMSNIAIMAVYNVLMLLTGGLTGYLGMKQDTLLNQVVNTGNRKTPEEVVMAPEGISRPDAEKHSDVMSQEEARHVQKMILEYLENDKPYLNTGFSMHDLCNHLNLSRRKISYVLNEVLDKNFYGVVNEFRIKEAEELLCKDEMNQVKIEVLGEMVGFQSKSSFNACFKKVTGMTPSEYKMKNRIESK
jgi:AraC-like DNA-binding protein